MPDVIKKINIRGVKNIRVGVWGLVKFPEQILLKYINYLEILVFVRNDSESSSDLAFRSFRSLICQQK